MRVAEEGEGAASGVPSARQEAMNSWRRGFIRCRIREGPIGSHQELARAEKWESSEAETEWVLVWVFVAGVGFVRNCVVGMRGRIDLELERRARRGRVRPRREAIMVLFVRFYARRLILAVGCD